ncbi:Chaperone protein DnaK [compost metagenome]
MHVLAKDKATGKEQKIRIEASSGLSDAEIEKMKKEAEANAEADKKAKEEIEKLNAADSLIFSTEKQLKEYGDKLSAGNKTAIEDALKQLKDAHTAKDFAGIEAASTALTNAWNAASEEMYKATQDAGAQPGPDAGQSSSGDNNSGDVKDVDFEEVK